MTPEGIFSL